LLRTKGVVIIAGTGVAANLAPDFYDILSWKGFLEQLVRSVAVYSARDEAWIQDVLS
jgi:hypothetical protein